MRPGFFEHSVPEHGERINQRKQPRIKVHLADHADVGNPHGVADDEADKAVGVATNHFVPLAELHGLPEVLQSEFFLRNFQQRLTINLLVLLYVRLQVLTQDADKVYSGAFLPLADLLKDVHHV